MELVEKKDYGDLCAFVARRVADYILQHPGTLVCLAAGDTMLGVFQELVKLGKQGEVNLSSAYYVSLDEWGNLGYETKGSCKQTLYDNFFIPAGIPEDKICFFDGLSDDVDGECKRIADFISAHGQIGISVLGVGMNGHVGFNEPYTKQNDVCLKVLLDPVTCTVSSKYFEKPVKTDFGITISINTLLDSQEILLVANGAKKTSIVYKTLYSMPSMAVPSTMLRSHKNCIFAVDAEANPC